MKKLKKYRSLILKQDNSRIREVLEYEGGEAIVITHIEELAEEQSKG
jgi:hypothetical protein